MKTKLLSLFVALICASSLSASYTEVDGIWYDFDPSTKTASVTYKGSYFNSDSTAYFGSIVIPETVVYNSVSYSITTIGMWAFSLCSGLTSVSIPNSVTMIEGCAFINCSGLTSVTIGNSVTTIRSEAFYGCRGLTSVTIPNSVTMIEEKAFSRVNNIVYNGTATGSPWGAKCVNGYIDGYLVYSDASKTTLCGCSSAAIGEITIPNSVTTIGEEAFAGCKGITSIIIPYSVTGIRSKAFSGCTGLKIVYNGSELPISKGSDSYGGVAYYAEKVYAGIIIGDFVIKSDTILNRYLGANTKVTIPNSITRIGEEAFKGCSNLTSVAIPNAVTTIGNYSFAGCSYLAEVTLGSSLNSIGSHAFEGDSRIESITTYAEITPNVGTDAFKGVSKQYVYLYVPENSIRKYQVDSNWNEFDIRTKSADKKPIDGDNPIVTPTEQDVTITWPITDGTDTYTLTITKNGEVVCVLTFNANGQLTNIAFAAPGHNGAHQAPAATLTAQGYQFTVTGLNPGTAYNYSVTATDAGGQTLAEHKGNFSTTGGTGLNTLPYKGKDGIGSKYFHNGNLIIERNGVKYTATGQKVR